MTLKQLLKKWNFARVCVKWVPRLLTSKMKAKCLCICAYWRDRLVEDGTRFDDIITMDESWMYCYNSATKQSTSQWQLRGAEPPIKQKAIRSRDKALAITFFDKQGFFTQIGYREVWRTSLKFFVSWSVYTSQRSDRSGKAEISKFTWIMRDCIVRKFAVMSFARQALSLYRLFPKVCILLLMIFFALRCKKSH